MGKLLLIIFTSISLFGCVGMDYEKPTNEDRSRTFNKEKEELYQKTVDVLFEMGAEIEHSNADTGIIQAMRDDTTAFYEMNNAYVHTHYNIKVGNGRIRAKIERKWVSSSREAGREIYLELWDAIKSE